MTPNTDSLRMAKRFSAGLAAWTATCSGSWSRTSATFTTSRSPIRHCGRDEGARYARRPIGKPERGSHPAAGAGPRYLRLVA
eukprot:8692025-Pyramimonas_sp.AAC.1